MGQVMAEPIILTPSWRAAAPFMIYRNPGSRERRNLFSGDRRTVRFTLAGDGSLYVGRAMEFLHGDMYKIAQDEIKAEPFWSGTLDIAGPNFPISYADILAPNISENDTRNVWRARHHTNSNIIQGEYNSRGDVCLGRTSHYRVRQRGILDRSLAWQTFTRGLRIEFSTIAPVAHPTLNEPPNSHSRFLVMLFDDGHFYQFPHDQDILDAERQLCAGEAILGLRFGGNGNCDVVFSEVSRPIEFICSLTHPFGDVLSRFDVTLDSRRIAK